MNLETFVETLKRAEAARKPLADALRDRRAEAERLSRRQEALVEAGQSSDRAEYLRNAGALHAASVAKASLGRSVRAADDLVRTLRYLPSDWHAAVPGRGLFCASFFVRDCRFEDGKPIALDPFWIEACAIRDREGDEKSLALQAAWASGADIRPGGSGPSDPLIRVRRPFGSAADAKRWPCGFCGANGYVVGFMELGHWSEEPMPYRQALDVLCLACPALTRLAERVDDEFTRLYP